MRPSPTSLERVRVPDDPRWPDGVPRTVDCVRLPRGFLVGLFGLLALTLAAVAWIASEVRGMRNEFVAKSER